MVVYKNDLFEVTLVEFVDPVLDEQVTGYGVVNRRTGVREAEARREFTAIALADGFEDQHLHPERYVETPKNAPVMPSSGGGAIN